eukprot:scaffold11625_cov123-Isochrysis_galbana.AAC.2
MRNPERPPRGRQDCRGRHQLFPGTGGRARAGADHVRNPLESKPAAECHTRRGWRGRARWCQGAALQDQAAPTE